MPGSARIRHGFPAPNHGVFCTSKSPDTGAPLARGAPLTPQVALAAAPMDPIHVLLATDRRCLWGCAVSMRSMAEHASAVADLRFHVMVNGVAPRDRDALSRSVTHTVPRASVEFVSFDPREVRHLQRSSLITRTAYARLFIDEALPEEAPRCIYIDCDLLFERDVGELWRLDLGGRTVGAVDNALWDDPARYQQRLGLERPEYFNSGVLLVDMNRWRRLAIGEKALRFAERTGDRLILHDQDALNGALQGDWIPLAPTWNSWVIHPELHPDSRAVFHFMGAPKPWHADYSGRFADKFFAYLDRTPYAGSRPWNPAGVGRALRRVRRRLPFLPSAVRIIRTRLRNSS